MVLREKIKSQKEILDSQNDIIKSMKMFVDIYQPEKIHEFVKMREPTFEDRKNKDIEKIKSEMEKELSKKSDFLKVLGDEYNSSLEIAMYLTAFVPPNLRKDAIQNVSENLRKLLCLEE